MLLLWRKMLLLLLLLLLLGQNILTGIRTVQPNGVGMPVCMTYFDQWERFVGRAHIRISFKNLRKYKQADEYLPTNDITGQCVQRTFLLCTCSRARSLVLACGNQTIRGVPKRLCGAPTQLTRATFTMQRSFAEGRSGSALLSRGALK